MPEGSDLHRLAVAVENLSGRIDTHVATLRGDIGVINRDVRQNTTDIGELETRVTGLEGRRMPLPVMNSVMSVSAVVVSAYVAFGRG